VPENGFNTKKRRTEGVWEGEGGGEKATLSQSGTEAALKNHFRSRSGNTRQRNSEITVSTKQNRKRIAKNTALLYLRTFVTAVASLLSVRYVLNALGVADFGLYSLVGGFVAILSFLPASLASATQRFFSHALGEGDQNRLRRIFSVNVVLYGAVAFVTILILSTLGLWFVSHHLELPQARFGAVRLLFVFASLSFICGVFSSPFIAIIIAHEEVGFQVAIAIGDSLMRLASAVIISNVRGDRIVAYGGLIAVASMVTCLLYVVVCVIRYEECRSLNRCRDKKLGREILGFTGWTLFGQMSTMARNQAVTVLLNQYFGPTVVAARSIANSVATQASILAQNLNVSLYAPIVKEYAKGNADEMYALVVNGSKLTFFLSWVIALPLFLEMEEVLRLWLKTPPENAALFARLGLVEALIVAVSLPVATAARAPGRVAMYELSLGTIQIGIFAFAWVAFASGMPEYAVYCIAIVANIVMFAVRLSIVKQLVGLPVGLYLKKAAVPVLAGATVSAVVVGAVKSGLYFSSPHPVVVIMIAPLISSVSMYFIGVDSASRCAIWRFLRRKMA